MGGEEVLNLSARREEIGGVHGGRRIHTRETARRRCPSLVLIGGKVYSVRIPENNHDRDDRSRSTCTGKQDLGM